MSKRIRFRAKVTTEMAWGPETYEATVTAEVGREGELNVTDIEPTPEEERRLSQTGDNW